MTSSLREFFLDMDYASVVRVFYDHPPNSCPNCYAPRDCCRCQVEIGRSIGDFVSQLLIMYKLDSDVKFAAKAEQLSANGGYLFLLDEFESLDRIWINYNRVVIRLAKNVNPMVIQADVGEDPESRFDRYWSRFLEQKVNVLHLVFGNRIVRDDALYGDLSLFIVRTFGETDIVSTYSKYYDSGKFTTAQQDMLKTVNGWVKSLSKEDASVGDGGAVVVMLLWCLFQEKDFIGKFFAKFRIGKLHVLKFFPLFADMCFDNVRYGGKYVKLYVLVLDSWFGQQQFLNV